MGADAERAVRVDGIGDALDELVHETDHTRVLRRRPAGTGSEPVIVKQFLGPGAGARLRRERTILGRLEGVTGVPHLCGDRERDADTLVETDGGTQRLADAVTPGGWPVPEVVRLARDLVDTVAALHRLGIVHGDLNPGNIMLDAQTGRPLVIDFDHATAYSGEAGVAAREGDGSGTLPYLAPEQTGRTGQAVDHRADLYGIGSTLYELASGRPPFLAEDPLELIHAHLARVPEPLRAANPQVPPALSAIVARLLEKEPDRRYQSADGLAHDLARLAEDLAGGRDTLTQLGERDFPQRLTAPARLVGRDDEVAALARVWSGLDGGSDGSGADGWSGADAVLVRGPAGVGKSALVERLRAAALAGGGRVVTGRADPTHRDATSAAVVQALRELGQLLLAGDDAQLRAGRARVTAALGVNLPLAAAVPEFACLLGVPPPDPSALRDCRRGELAQAWADLLVAARPPEQPLVVVLEDLHAAARTDLDVLDVVLGAGGPPGLLPVLVTRTQDGGRAQELSRLVDRWRAVGRRILALEPGNLTVAHLTDLVGTALRLPVRRVADLAEVVHGHTGGNPRQTLELLDALRHEDILRAGEREWEWDEPRALRYIAVADAGQLPVEQLHRMPRATVGRLVTLACLGGRAPMHHLAIACGTDPATVGADLAAALARGLLIEEADPGSAEPVPEPVAAEPLAATLGAGQGLAGQGLAGQGLAGQGLAGQGLAGRRRAVEMTGAGPTVRFCHDRLREAALERLDPARRASRHLTVARRLRTAGLAAPLVADQYLPALSLLIRPRERREVAALFRDAAREVRLCDPDRAGRLLDAAHDLLHAAADPGVDAVEEADANIHGADAGIGPPGTRSGRTVAGPDDPLAVEVARDRHAALYELGRLEDADTAYAGIERRVTHVPDLAGPACVQIAALTNRARTSEAVRLGLDLLGRLGIATPADIQSAIRSELAATADWATSSGPGGAEAAELTDPRLLAAGTVMHRLLTSALQANPYTYPWLTLAARRLWAEYGPSHALIATTAGAPGFLIALQEDYPTALLLSRQAIEVGQRHGWDSATSIARCQYTVSVGHWFEPLPDVIGLARQTRERLLRAVEPQYAAMTYRATLPGLLECGPTLDAVQDEIDAALALAARTGSRYDRDLILPYRQLLRALRGRTRSPGGFDDEEFDEATHLADPQLTPTARTVHHIARALSAALFGQGADLVRYAEAAIRQLAFIPGHYLTALAQVLQALAIAHRVRAAADPDRAGPAEGLAESLAELDLCRDWLSERAADAPANFAHLVHLVDAERAWAVGEHWTAARAFDAAVGGVLARERPWHHALIAERAGAFLLDQGLHTVGQELTSRALSAYQAWGADAVAGRLERNHPGLSRGTRRDPRHAGTHRSHGTSSARDLVDLLGVIKASQAISQETSLDRLTERLTVVVGELSGATSVRILLHSAETQEWTVLQAGSAEGIPLAEAGRPGPVPHSAVRIAERTLQPLLVADLTADPRFADDPYLDGVDHCSLMVIPVLGHAELRALLVLENRLSRNVFTADQLGALTLVAGQLAVSLDNALAERFRSLVRRASDATLVCRRDGRLSYASPAAAELVGLPGGELLGRDATDLFHPEDRPAVLARVAPADGDPTPPALQCRVLRADGRHRWVEIAFTDLSTDPAVAGVVLHLRDVSERRRLETELRHAHKMESVGQLAAGLAHEINTPIQFVGDNLTFIASALDDLTRVLQAYRGPDPDGPTAAEVAAEVDLDFLLEDLPNAVAQTRSGIERVADIVRAMKASAHPGSDAKTPTDLNQIIRDTLIIANNEIKYVADVEQELADLPDVPCHRADLNQVVLNLVVNAAQAIAEKVAGTTDRGVLTIRTRRQDRCALIEVADTGTGIPPEAADRVFEPFFTTKPVGKGTGQGLALAYFLIHDRHGGEIDFRTVPGEGTTFTVRLPLDDDG